MPVDFLKLPKDGAFHRALSDAYYAAMVLRQIRDPQVLQKVSFDTFRLPQNRKEEVRIVFDDYANSFPGGATIRSSCFRTGK